VKLIVFFESVSEWSMWIQLKVANYERTLLITDEFKRKWRNKDKKNAMDKDRRRGK